MQKHITLYFFLLFLCVVSTVYGNPITANQAQRIAEDFFKSTAATRSAATLKLVHQPVQTRSGGAAEYFVFAPDADKGFVIVSGDDALTPIVGYSPDEPFRAERMPDALKAWLEDYVSYVTNVRAEKITPRIETRGGEAVAPLLKTKWDQSMPYNNDCPIMNGGQRAPSGCVATAMAQVMKYHNWPEKGTGVISWQEYGNWIERDLAQSVYDWQNMKDEYISRWDSETGNYIPDNYTDVEAAAVAKLMHECGRAINIQYGPNETGGFPSHVARALYENFYYAPQIKLYSRENYTNAEWTALIRSNLLEGLPVMYGGQGDGGHEFVCDGIDANDYLHINWGWGGSSDGYFDMNVMSPNDLGIGAGSGGYYKEQDIVANIRPIKDSDAGVERDMRPTAFGFTLLSNPVQQRVEEGSGERIYARMHIRRMSNQTGKSFNYNVGLVIYDKDGNVVKYDANGSIINLEPNYYSSNREVDIEITDLSPGEYTIGLRYWDNIDWDWQTFKTFDTGNVSPDIHLTMTDTEARLSADFISPDLHLVELKTTKTQYTGSLSFVGVIKNMGEAIFNNVVYVILVPEAEDAPGIDFGSGKYESFKQEIYVYGGGKATEVDLYAYRIAYTPGKYRVYICTWADYVYTPLPEAAPQYIEVKERPDYPIVTLTRKLSLWEDEYFQESDVWLGATVFPVADKGYSGKLELWALKEGDDASKEVCLLSKDINIGTSSSQYLEDFYGDCYTMITLDEGVYTAYLKYEADGKMTRIEGDENEAIFVLKAADTPQLYMNAPMIINEGKDVSLGSMIEVKLSFTSRVACTGSISLYSSKEIEGKWYTALGSIGSLNFSLEAGETKTVSVYCNAGTESSLLGTHRLSASVNDIGLIGYGTYEESTKFNLVDAEIAQTPKLAAAPIINNGAPVEQGTTGNVKAKVLSATDLTGKMFVFSQTWECIDILQGSNVSVDLKAGMEQEVTLPYSCPKDSKEGKYQAKIYFIPDGSTNSYLLDYNSYEGYSWFNVVLPTGINNESTAQCRLYPQPGAFLLKGVAENSRIQVSALDGRTLFRGIAAEAEITIPMSEAVPGFYLITIEMPDGKVQTMKGILKK